MLFFSFDTKGSVPWVTSGTCTVYRRLEFAYLKISLLWPGSTPSTLRAALLRAHAASLALPQSRATGHSTHSTRRARLFLPMSHAPRRSTQHHLRPWDQLPPYPPSLSSCTPLVLPAIRDPHLCFVKVLVLVVFRALQGQLEGEAILGDLVDPYSRGNFSRSRVSSALLARFGGSVRLP